MIDGHTERKMAVDHWIMRRLLRSGGIWSILFGIFTLVIGLGAEVFSAADYAVVALGILLLVEGIWILKSPSPAMILAEGFLFVLLAAWNTYDLVTVYRMGADFDPFLSLIHI